MYLLTKVVLAIMLGFITSTLVGLVIVPLLKRMGVGQKISSYMDFAHRSKEGTPTMGGFIFIISTLLVMAILLITGKVSSNSDLMIVLFVFVSYAIIGFIDDYLNNMNEWSEARLRYSNDVPWAKMVRRDLVVENHILFDEVPASNDTMFSLMAGYYANSINADKNVVYKVTVRQGSITKTKSVERYFSDHCVALRKNKFVREIGHPECQEVILSRLLIVLKNYGYKEFLRFMKEVKRYDGKLFFGLRSKIGLK